MLSVNLSYLKVSRGRPSFALTSSVSHILHSTYFQRGALESSFILSIASSW